MPREGIDYAWRNGVDTDAFRRAGATFVVRYLSHDARKNLSAPEAQVLSEAGFDIVVVWESSARRACDGKNAGAEDAHAAAAQAKACGMPANRPIYFGVDFDAAEGDKPKIVDYLHGAAGVLGGRRVGVYGGYWVVKHCFDHAAIAFGWQTYAWSGGRRDRRAQLYQHRNGLKIGGVSCDLDTAYAPDFGQWRLPCLTSRLPGTTGGMSNADEVKGRLKEAAGDLTDDRDLKREGKIDRAAGAAKEGVDKATEKVKDAATSDS